MTSDETAPEGTTVYDMADLITRITGEVTGVVTLPRDGILAAQVLRGQVAARRPVLVITKDDWDFFEPRYGLIGRYAYEVRDVSPGGLVRLHCSLGRYQAQPKPLPIEDFLGLTRPEIATMHPEQARPEWPMPEDQTGPGVPHRGDAL